MPSTCSLLKTQYASIKALKAEFDLALETATTGATTPEQAKQALEKAKALKALLEQRRDTLFEMLWTFENLSQKEFKEQYNLQLELCREKGFLQTLSSGHEGIKDNEGNEYPMPTLKEVTARLKSNDLYKEKIATFENPFILITPFALNPQKMAEQYSQQIEEHFVEEKTEVDRRIPNKDNTKLFGVDGEPLELRTDGKNVYFSDSLKNLVYFPEWKEENGSTKPIGGITKKEAIAQAGGWTISIIESIPLAPEGGQGKPIEKEIRMKGKTKKVRRKQVEGGLNAAQQYKLLQQQNEEGFTLEDWIYFAMLYLKRNNVVLDDNRRTNYYCRLLGAAAADGNVPNAYWYRDIRQAYLYGGDPGDRYGFFGVRGRVRVKKL